MGVSGPAAPGQRGPDADALGVLDKPMSARELAQQLDMHLGVVCRDLGNLFNSKLLITESVKGRNRYRTNRESLDTLARHLMEMEKFKPPEAAEPKQDESRERRSQSKFWGSFFRFFA